MARLVVIGGDAAGMSAAAKARRTDPGLSITVIERGQHASFAACGIPYFVGRSVAPEKLIARAADKFREDGIDLRLDMEATGINLHHACVDVRDPAGHLVEVPFDRLVIATGASAIRPDIPGAAALNAFTVRHLDDGLAFERSLPSRGRAVIVGAGYVGLEFAEALRARGLAVSVLEAAGRVFPSLEPAMSELVAVELEANGVEVITGARLGGLEVTAEGEARAALLEDGRRLPGDVFLFAAGVRPNVGLAADAGLDLDETGAIGTDEQMRTSHSDIWAAGDCTSALDLVTGRRTWTPLGTTANKQGRVAGENAAGGHAAFRGIVRSSVAKVFGLEVARTGLSSAEAAAAGLDAVSATISSTDRAHYYPGAARLTVTLVGTRDGRLLGGQLAGGGAAARVNIIATAIHAGMSPGDVARLDLAYAPPFSPVWDPVIVAAQQLEKELGRS